MSIRFQKKSITGMTDVNKNQIMLNIFGEEYNVTGKKIFHTTTYIHLCSIICITTRTNAIMIDEESLSLLMKHYFVYWGKLCSIFHIVLFFGIKDL